MSAPTTEQTCEPSPLEQMELYERFTIRFMNTEQTFELSTAEEDFRVCLSSTGLPVFVDYPDFDDIFSTDNAAIPKHLRIREGQVIVGETIHGERVGYDLVFNTMIAYDNENRVCWRSGPIIKIVRVVERL